jgi:hypothetical protein
VAATTIIRESSSCKLEHCRYKALFVLLCILNKIRFTSFINVKLGKHWLLNGIEIIEHHEGTHSNSKWMSSRTYELLQQLALWQPNYDQTIKVF